MANARRAAVAGTTPARNMPVAFRAEEDHAEARLLPLLVCSPLAPGAEEKPAASAAPRHVMMTGGLHLPGLAHSPSQRC
jgi:hypothetical protein